MEGTSGLGEERTLFGFENTDFEVGMEHPCENSQWANGFKDLGDRRVKTLTIHVGGVIEG